MSGDPRERPGSPLDDPFLAEDPAARERERRRLEREAKRERRGRANRQSLASRVSGALDGATARGREALEQSRERARSPEPTGEGVEPPSFRRTPAAPGSAAAPESQPEAAPGPQATVARAPGAPSVPEASPATPVPTEAPAPSAPKASEVARVPEAPPRERAPVAPPAVERPARASRPQPSVPPESDRPAQAAVTEPSPAQRETGEPGPRAAAPLEATAPPAERRMSAEELMPRREVLRTPDTGEDDAVPPAPIAVPAGGGRPDSEEWSVPAPAAAAAADGDGDGLAPARTGARRAYGGVGGSWALWRRRLLALAGIVVVVAGGAFALSKAGGGDPPPPPAAAPKKVKTTSITIPEGLTAEQMATTAKQAGLKGSYEEAVAKASKKFDLAGYGAPKGASLEGFLFPATYEVEKGAPASDLVDKQLQAFRDNLAQVDLSRAKKKNLTVFDVATIGSMIEREVQVSSERPIVSAVIYNRLQQDIPLEIDATVRYAIGNDFDKSLTTSDLEVDSPYNTYRNPGLPVGPIANPGLDSLQAAADPADKSFLYYVVKPGTCGEHVFTKSYDEFLAASQAYDDAQAAAGGSPTKC